MKDLCFIIVNWNTRQLLLQCIDSIYKSDMDLSYSICVVDNGSKDDSVKLLKSRFPEVNIIANSENRGFAAAVNQGLEMNATRYHVLLNTDTILYKNSIQLLHSFLEHYKDVGIAGGQLLKSNGTKQHSFDNYPTLVTELLNKSILRWLLPNKYLSKKSTISQPIEVESLIGACIMVRNKAIEQVGKLDEDYFFFLEETDWCYRMQKAGWKVFFIPDAKIIHLGGQSKKMAPWQSQIEYCRSLYLFFRKNRSSFVYRVFRAGYFLKILINFFTNLIGNLFVLFIKQKLRYRLSVYFRLLWWHLLLCPETMGLKPENRKKK